MEQRITELESRIAELEAKLGEVVIKPKKQKRTVNPDAMAKNKERLRKVQDIAREIRIEEPNITNSEAMSKAWTRFKNQS
jgi:uncharacterized coiled-coil protein SlyX